MAISEAPFTTVDGREEPRPTSWQDLVTQLADQVWHHSNARAEVRGQLSVVLAVIADDVRIELDDAAEETADAALRVGVLMGYALARTWPDRVEGLDAWGETARAYAGITLHEPNSARPKSAPLHIV